METLATILHADLDAFYASVEQLLNPSLRGKPIAVGGGVVLAASYEAKAFGVRGGMPGRRARELCPQLIFVDGHFKDYQRLGDAAIAMLGDYTPLVERISIDEAFADVAGCTHLFGSPADIAATIRHRVRTELGLPISVGVARTKHLAKIASQVAKPDGMVLVDPKTELKPALLHLADRVASRLRAKSLAGSTVTVRVRFADMRAVTRSTTLDAPISATVMLAEIAEELVRVALADHPQERTITLLAISVSQLRKQPEIQLDLPLELPDEKRRPGAKKGIARWTADRAIDTIRDRFGRDAVGYAATALDGPRSVPDGFRELAEKEL
ncbi:DNA polymerase IV [Mesorhizobium sp.]|uniref:Y-family DNA polymerase n=1 Tax=Mesorhizobium sp. TaxID=1871066 RepID=UPI000FEA3FAA|nr:DNA polymerase IV [Mesorhizobium sp.]RWM43692.1 MAG: DNA polymerase IV [Mesorhizobium sp.]RWM58279.1 MAG: DNA polymerase IV [Mesorhizobium sp.]RWM58556.1 MAG: DNA polymerase IV [Mesorhizobium sp.]TIO63959.1 MAG: DNA polymerase IV [Mesorhizobium sp.]TJV89771.1 MAG: DNA polymerase IV [Mesorhizobium sp.]